MKYCLPRFRTRNDSGIILLVVLWMMVILSFLAVGLGRRTSIDLALTKFAVGQSRASNLAWAGLMYAIDQIKKDSEDSAAAGLDTAYLCGITLEEGQVPEDIFKEVRLGDAVLTSALLLKTR